MHRFLWSVVIGNNSALLAFSLHPGSSLAKKPVAAVAVFQRDLDQRLDISRLSSSQDREQIVSVLQELGAEAVPAVRSIAYWGMHDKDLQCRETCRQALLKIGKHVVPELVLDLEGSERPRWRHHVLCWKQTWRSAGLKT